MITNIRVRSPTKYAMRIPRLEIGGLRRHQQK
jgi:hypothetical protein